MKIIYIRPGKSRGYLRMGIEVLGKISDISVSETDYSKGASPLVGDTLTDEEYEFFTECNMRYVAMKKALSLLSYADNSERSLLNKLIKAGIKRDIAEETVAETVRLGYINSIRQIERLALNEVRFNNTGPAKLVSKLVSKGYRMRECEEIISRLKDSGELDFESAKMRLIKAKIPENADNETVKKLLYKNGYEIC